MMYIQYQLLVLILLPLENTLKFQVENLYKCKIFSINIKYLHYDVTDGVSLGC